MKRLVLAFMGLLPFVLFSQNPLSCPDRIIFNKMEIAVRPYAGWYDISSGDCSMPLEYSFGVNGDSNKSIHLSVNWVYGLDHFTQLPKGNRDDLGLVNDFSWDSLGDIFHDTQRALIRMGPYSTNAVTEESNWQKYWLLNRWDIDYHLMNYTNSGYTMLNDIATWPAHGDTTLGESFYLAPFEDANNNGVYDPENGDYPLIKGSKCLYMIMNDVWHGTGPSELTEQLNYEMHKMIYSYDCYLDSALNYTVFVDQRIINKGPYQIDELSVGNVVDFDIGNPYDDYLGTNVEGGYIYAYNADMYDEGIFLSSGYQTYIPAQSFGYLKGMKLDDNGADDGIAHNYPASYNGLGFADGITDNEYFGLSGSFSLLYYNYGYSYYPSSYNDYWNYLSGKWLDGQAMLYGGLGHPYNSPSAMETAYMFPGHSDPAHLSTGSIDPGFIWSEDSMNNMPDERIMLAYTKGNSLMSGEETVITSFYTYARDYSIPGRMPSVALLENYVGDIRNYFSSDNTPCGQGFGYYYAHQTLNTSEGNLEGLVSVYPNPSNNQITISGIELDQALVQIYDSRGALVMNVQNPESSVFDISNLEIGVYILNIVVEEGVVSKKIIKE